VKIQTFKPLESLLKPGTFSTPKKCANGLENWKRLILGLWWPLGNVNKVSNPTGQIPYPSGWINGDQLLGNGQSSSMECEGFTPPIYANVAFINNLGLINVQNLTESKNFGRNPIILGKRRGAIIAQLALLVGKKKILVQNKKLSPFNWEIRENNS